MKASKKLALAVSAVALAVFSGSALAQTLITKADNAIDLNNTDSWVGAVVPTVTDIAVWDETILSANTTVLGADTTWGGIRIGTSATGNPTGDVVIGGANTLTLDQYGVDLTNATVNLTVDAPVNMSASQLWSLGTGRTMTVNGNLGIGANTFTKGGNGTLTVSSMTISAGSLFASNGTMNVGGTTVLANPLTVDTASASTVVNLSGSLDVGANAVTKTGLGTLSVGTLIWSGATVPVSPTAGAVNINSPLTFSAPTTVSATGGTMTIAGLSTNGANKITKMGAGTVTFGGGLSSFANLTDVEVVEGTLNLNQPAAVAFATPQTWTMGAGARLNINNAVSTGGLGITKLGAGTIGVGPNPTTGAQSALTLGAGSAINVNEGTLVLSGNRTDSGPVNLTGTLTLVGPTGNGNVFMTPLGGGSTVTFTGGTLTATSGAGPTTLLHGNVIVPAGQTGTINMSNRFEWGQRNVAGVTHTLTGAGTLNVNTNTTVTRDDFNVSLNGFTGNLNFGGSGGIRLLYNVTGSRFTPPTNATVDFSGSVVLAPTTFSGGSTFSMASLSGSSPTAILGGGSAGTISYQWGLANINTTFAGQVQGNAALNKVGSGTTSFTGQTLSYSGTTSINGGMLALNGIKSGAGAINVASGAALGGTGTTTGGTVNILSGGILSPGNSIGTLTLSTLSFSNGATGAFEFNTVSATNDQVVVTTQLNLVGTTNLSLYTEGTTTPFSTNGTYNLISFTGLSGTPATAFGIAVASQVAGKKYTFGTASNVIQLVISDNLDPTNWIASGGGDWDNNANWSNLAPSLAGSTARFGTPGTVQTPPGPVVVSLNGADRTVGTVQFDDVTPFTISGGANRILLENAGAPGVISTLNGSHTVDAEVAMGTLGATFNVTNVLDTLTFAKTISGTDASINKTGAGTVVLTTPVTYTGPTIISAGVLRLSGANDILPTNVTPQITGTLDLGGTNQSFQMISGPGVIRNDGLTDSVLTLTDNQTVTTPINDGTAKTSVTFTGNNLTMSANAGFSGGLALTQTNTTLNVTVGGGLGTGPVSAPDGTVINVVSPTTIFVGTPVNVAPGAKIAVTSSLIQHGVNGVFTFGDAASEVTLQGGPTVSLGGFVQQFVGAGTVQIPGDQTVRLSGTTLNNGGADALFHIDGTLTTRNNGFVTLGSLEGAGTVTSGFANGSGPTVVYTVGTKGVDNDFAGTFQGGGIVTVGSVGTATFQGLTKAGLGKQIFSGFLNYNGVTTISAGTLQFGNNSGPNGFPTGDIVNNGTFTLYYGSDLDASNAFSGTGELRIIGSGLVALHGNLTYTGDTSIIGTGRLSANVPLKPLATTGALTVQGGGNGSVTLDPTGYATNAYMTVGSFAAINVGTSGQTGSSLVTVLPIDRTVGTGNLATVLVGDSLNIAPDSGTTYAGFVDLGNSDMILRAGDVAGVRAAVAHWYNAGGTPVLFGLGATSANPGVDFTTLAVFPNTTGTAGVGYYASYDGVAGLTDTAVIVKFAYIGDTNIDGVLNASDLSNIIEGLSTGATGWENGDLNYDGVVNVTDLNLFNSALAVVGSNSLGNGQGPSGNSGGVVPEPTSLGLLLAAAPLVSRRRRR